MEMTWYTRDLPVLVAAVECLEDSERSSYPKAADLAPIVGLDEMEVAKSIKRLSGEYISTESGFEGMLGTTVNDVHPAGRRAAGQWPNAELIAQKLIAGFEAAAVDESDPEKKSKLKQTAVFLGSSGKDLLINLVASVIAKSAGLG